MNKTKYFILFWKKKKKQALNKKAFCVQGLPKAAVSCV